MYKKATIKFHEKEMIITVKDIIHFVSEIYIDGILVSVEKKVNVSFLCAVKHSFNYNGIDEQLVVMALYKSPILFDVLVIHDATLLHGNEQQLEKCLKIVKKYKDTFEKYKNKMTILRYLRYGFKQGIIYMVLIGLLDVVFFDFSIIEVLMKGFIFGLIIGMISWASQKNDNFVEMENIINSAVTPI